MHIQNFDPYDFKKKKISGVNVYYKNLPWAPCIHINFNISAGALSDKLNKEGTAHFLEHLIGNGCSSLPNKKAIKEFNRLYMINSRNAYTSLNETAYVGKCLPENFSKVFETMNEMVFHPLIKPEDVEHERKVITQEAWGRYKNDKFLKHQREVSKKIYGNTNRARFSSPLGWPDTIAKINQNDLRDFHSKYYNKENLSIFIAGAVNEGEIEIIKNKLKNIPPGKKNILKATNYKKLGTPRVEKVADEIGQISEQVVFALASLKNKNMPDYDFAGDQAMDLIKDILYERLRLENSLCYGINVGRYIEQDYVCSNVVVNTSLDKLSIVKEEFWKILKEIQEDKWEERFKTIHKVYLDYMKSNERSSGLVINGTVEDINTYGKIFNLKEIFRNEKKVTYKDIKDLLKDTFDKKNIYEEIILPSKKQK